MNLIAKETYPLLHKAWTFYRLDNGIINRIEPEEPGFMTVENQEVLEKAEKELSTLTEQDIEFFVCGEQSESSEKFKNCENCMYLFTEWWS